MASPSSRIGVSNHRAVPHVVAVEPWGEDFTLLPGEGLEIQAFGKDVVPWFHCVECEGASQVYCEEAVYFMVSKGGTQLECGHNRQLPSLKNEREA